MRKRQVRNMAIIFMRTLIIFISLIVLMRLLGKRQMRELELSELVVSVMIADLAATPLQDIGIPLINGLVPIITIFACELLITGLNMESVRFRGIMCGKPSFLILDGVIQQGEMRRAQFSLDELMEELRGREILDIDSVKYAILETDGTLSTILTQNERPLTLRTAANDLSDSGYPVMIIEDGVLLDKNLKHIGKSRRWLEKELRQRGANGIKDVFIMIFYESGKIYFAPKEAKNA